MLIQVTLDMAHADTNYKRHCGFFMQVALDFLHAFGSFIRHNPQK